MDFFGRRAVQNKNRPVLTVTDPGSHCTVMTLGANPHGDNPSPCIWCDDVWTKEVCDAIAHPGERADAVTFLTDRSLTSRRAMLAAGIPVARGDQGCTVSMFLTNRDCRQTRRLFVSVRPIPADEVSEAAVSRSCAQPSTVRWWI